MRFELDEARSNNAASGHSRGVTGSSGAPTLSRNLGAEISRRLEEAQGVSEEEEDSYVETVVTTQKTRVSILSLTTRYYLTFSRKSAIGRIDQLQMEP